MFIASGQASCILDNLYLLMINIAVIDGCLGMVEGCVIVSINSSLKDHKDVMYGVVLLFDHHGPRYLDICLTDVHVLPTLPPMLSTSSSAKN